MPTTHCSTGAPWIAQTVVRVAASTSTTWTRKTSTDDAYLSWANVYRNWSFWCAAGVSLNGGEVTEVVPPSTSFALAPAPAAPPVTIPYRPDVTLLGCFRPAAVDVACGAVRDQTPDVAVSVPSAFRAQPRLTSKSSSKTPQRTVRTARPRIPTGQDAQLIRSSTAALLRPVSDAISESSG
jgi:hypothetical protein